MTKYFCDICQEELGRIEDMVCIDFNHFGVLRDIADKEIQVCERCAERAYKTIMLLSLEQESTK